MFQKRMGKCTFKNCNADSLEGGVYCERCKEEMKRSVYGEYMNER